MALDDELYIIKKSRLTAIGDAIREKLGETEEYSLAEMPEKILSIEAEETGGTVPEE